MDLRKFGFILFDVGSFSTYREVMMVLSFTQFANHVFVKNWMMRRMIAVQYVM